MGRAARYARRSVSRIAIRAYTEADVLGIIELWRAAGLIVPHNDPDRDIRFARTSGHGDVFVAEYEGRLVATIMVGHEGHRGWLYYLAVDPTVQRKGLGRAMVRYAEKWLGARGVPKVMLMIRETNLGVRGFYDRLGYGSEPRLVMSRWLEKTETALGKKKKNATESTS
jgi:ribosomal protein S18 acetylase RimI-like enzyme